MAMSNGQLLTLGRESSLSLNEQMLADSSNQSSSSEQVPAETPSDSDLTDVERLQAAIEAGVDPTLEGEATAAGPGAGAGGAPGAAGGGHSFVLLGETAGALEPIIGFPTAGLTSGPEFPDPEPLAADETPADEPSPPDFTPEIEVVYFDSPPDDGEGNEGGDPDVVAGPGVVNEAALSDGSTPGSNAEFTYGTLVINSPDGISRIEVQGADGVWVNVQGGGTVIGEYGTLQFDAAGNWVYILTDNTLDHSVDNATGAADQVGESFPVRVFDGDGDVSPTVSLDLVVYDDGPSASDYAHNEAITEGSDATTLAADAYDALGIAGGADGVKSVTFGAGSAGGSLAIVDGALVYTPPATVDNSGGDVEETFSFTVTDGDDDTVTQTVTLNIADGAGPSAGDPISLVVDDQNLSDGSSPATPVTDDGSITFTPGSDAIASIAFSDDLTSLTGGLTWSRESDNQIVGKDGGVTIVTLSLVVVDNVATVTATLADNYDSHPDIDVDDLQSLGSVTVVATDTDGDFVEGTVNVSVSDDLPTLGEFTFAILPNEIGTANGFFEVEPGADGLAGFQITGPVINGLTYTTVNNFDGGEFVSTTLIAKSTANEAVFELTVNADGTYNFELVKPEASTSQTFSLLNLSAGGPAPWLETQDGRIEFTGNGKGVNSSGQGFGVDNQFVGVGERFAMEFHNPGTPGDDSPNTNPQFVEKVVLVNDNINGSLNIRWIATNTLTGAMQTGLIAVVGATTTIDPTISFNHLEIIGPLRASLQVRLLWLRQATMLWFSLLHSTATNTPPHLAPPPGVDLPPGRSLRWNAWVEAETPVSQGRLAKIGAHKADHYPAAAP